MSRCSTVTSSAMSGRSRRARARGGRQRKTPSRSAHHHQCGESLRAAAIANRVCTVHGTRARGRRARRPARIDLLAAPTDTTPEKSASDARSTSPGQSVTPNPRRPRPGPPRATGPAPRPVLPRPAPRPRPRADAHQPAVAAPAVGVVVRGRPADRTSGPTSSATWRARSATAPSVGSLRHRPSGRPYPRRDMTRSYEIRTYGCQMNVHDSERLAGLLEDAGLRARATPAATPADLVVFNTCAVRENADNRLYGNLGHLYPAKAANPDMQIAVGGCLAQKDRGRIVEKAPWVDVVFGTHNLAALPVLLERARHNRAGAGRDRRGAAELPVRPAHAPRLRRTAPGCRSRSAATTPARSASSRRCAAPRPTAARATSSPRSARWSSRGVVEVTLLGQNVNSYGRSFGDRVRVRQAAARLRRRSTASSGSGSPARTRATSPTTSSRRWPRRRTSCRSCTCRCSPGRTRCSRRCAARTGSERYLGIIDAVRAAMPDAAITTDIIVGFPGETEDDFEQTLDAVRAARFASAFTFQYSKRPGTPAAEMAGQVPKDGRAGALRAADRAAGRDLVGRRPRRSSAARSRCWSARPTDARTAPPAGCPGGPATAGSCTSPARPARATSSPPRSPTPRRTTWWPTPASATHRRVARPGAEPAHGRAGQSAADDRAAPRGIAAAAERSVPARLRRPAMAARPGAGAAPARRPRRAGTRASRSR